MKHFSQEIRVPTTKSIEFIDVTEHVRRVVAKSGVKNGLVSIFSNHTTTAIRVNERCARLQKDMVNLLCEMVPQQKPYQHNEATVDGRGNAHSHLMSLLMGGAETVPVMNGGLRLGTWQSIFFIELDGPRNNRNLTVTILGE
jgi:secondary thiamine-phosphate synthase enzyme